MSGGDEGPGCGDEIFGRTQFKLFDKPYTALGKFLDLPVCLFCKGTYFLELCRGLHVMKYIKGLFLVLPSLLVCFQHAFPALQSSPTINIFHLLEPSIPAQVVCLPSPKTYVVSQIFLPFLANPWYVLSPPSLLCPVPPHPPQSCSVSPAESGHL